MIKHSKQRESIKNFLQERQDHPTAETVYMNIKEELPNISLGTVYRNLSLLCELGEIQKIPMENGSDRFDGNPNLHYHFTCRKCNGVIDLHVDELNHINILAAQNFDGTIEGHNVFFYGLCPKCRN